jgi:aspartate 1-decarboxylase
VSWSRRLGTRHPDVIDARKDAKRGQPGRFGALFNPVRMSRYDDDCHDSLAVSTAPCSNGRASIPEPDAATSIFLHEPVHSMFRHLLKSKIHRATVTHCELHYEGSCAIDEDLLDASDIRENEQVHIWNVNNGERFITYAIRAERGSGIVSLNGSAARRASVGDLVIIAAFGMVSDSQPAPNLPRLVFVDADNRATELKHVVAVQTAAP